MQPAIRFVLLTALGFICGSLMNGYYIAKLSGVDIIKLSDDGNPGAANVIKHVGIYRGLLCVLLDVAKGFVPVFLATHLVDPMHWAFSFVMLAPVCGHAFSPFLKGRGGKAVAVTFGVFLGALFCSPMIVYLVVIIVLFSVVVRIDPHALRVMISLVVLFAVGLLRHEPLSILVGTGLVGMVVIYKHLRGYNKEKFSIHLFLSKSER